MIIVIEGIISFTRDEYLCPAVSQKISNFYDNSFMVYLIFAFFTQKNATKIIEKIAKCIHLLRELSFRDAVIYTTPFRDVTTRANRST